MDDPGKLAEIDERLTEIESMKAADGYGERTARLEAYAGILRNLEGSYMATTSEFLLDAMDTVARAIKALASEDCD